MGCQLWTAYAPCGSQHKDAVQITLEQVIQAYMRNPHTGYRKQDTKNQRYDNFVHMNICIWAYFYAYMHILAVCDDTKIWTEPNPKLFSDTKYFRYRIGYFFCFQIPNPRLFFIPNFFIPKFFWYRIWYHTKKLKSF